MVGVEWFKNAVIYQIFIDRFNGFSSKDQKDLPQFLGGNLRGIIDKLDYIKGLGFNTIWISPFFQNTEYHGYHITDFYKVDSHFGTLDDLKELIKKTHEKSMRIICDFVPNHVSCNHPFFIEAKKDNQSRYCRWFYFTKWPNKYLCYKNYETLPKLNLDYLQARDYIISAAKYWLHLGFDGFRLDHAVGPSHSFWKEFRKEIKSEREDFVLIGEVATYGFAKKEYDTIRLKNMFFKKIFGISQEKAFKEYIGELDGVLDFYFLSVLRDLIKEKISQKEFTRLLAKHYLNFPNDFFLVTFLDNHDMNRFLFECQNDKQKLKTAAELQFRINQPIIVYYGTETGMTQNKEISGSHGDLAARQPMNWDNIDNDLLEFYRNLIIKRISGHY